jgi:glucose-6-phosphate isomerase
MVIKSRITRVDAFHLGLIIALYERAVAVYAEFININAFHQPGVQAYKLAAKGILKLAGELDAKLAAITPATGTAEEIAAKCGLENEISTVSGFLARKAVNHPEGNVVRYSENGKWIYQIR